MAGCIHVNNVHCSHIAQIYALPIFNGNKTLSQWIGWARAQVVLSDSEMGNVTNTGDQMGNTMAADVELNEDDEVTNKLDNIVQFMDNLATVPNE